MTRKWLSLLMAPVTLIGASLVPLSAVAAGVAVAGVAELATAAPAGAAAPAVLILSTSVTGGLSSAEAQAATAAGATVSVATPASWDAMTTAQFGAYSAVVIGDPSSGGVCSSAAPADALSTAATWGAAITGNVAVLGTAPVLAGSAGSALITDGISYALSGSGTGLYVSLNCENATSAAGAPSSLLAQVDGGGFTVTGQSASCPNSGTVNTWESVSAAAFRGLTSSALGSWAAPACSVQETFNAWPAGFTAVGYDKAASPADFTASDGVTGQPYVLLGSPVSAATAALAPSTGGEVPAGALVGGANAAAPGVSHDTAADPVDTENGDFSQAETDVSIPTFGPALDFTRTYDALLAQSQTQTGTPGPMGYGWTDSFASSLSAARPVPGDIYTIDGLATGNGDGGAPDSSVLNTPGGVWSDASGVYIADTAGNRVQEIPATSGTQWGIAMTAGDVYTIAGSPTGVTGDSPSGTAAASALLDAPASVITALGNLYIADTDNSRVLEIPATSGSQRGVSMTAGDIYVIAGQVNGAAGTAGDGGAATSAFLDAPAGLAPGHLTSDLYIADTGNNRVQEIPAATGTQWGQAMTANDIYTVAGSAAGTSGTSGDGGNARSGRLDEPRGVQISGGHDLYIADTGNNRIQEVAAATGAQWNQAMTANDVYTVAGSPTGVPGHSGDGGAAASALLSMPTNVRADNGQQLYITDFGNNRIQEIARTSHTEFGTAMTVNDIYTIAGSATGAPGFSGDAGPATSAKLDQPEAATVDGSLNLYIADTANDRVREVNAATGDISTLAGDGFTLANDGNRGPAVNAAVQGPDGLATDSMGDVFIADTLNNRVQEIAATSHTQFTIAMVAGQVYTVAGLARGAAGSAGDGAKSTSAQLDAPVGVAADASGDLFIADDSNNRVQEVSNATGLMSTFAGSASGASGSSGNGGAATSALLDGPWGVAVDSAGDVFIADSGNNRVQEVFAAGGQQFGQHMTAGDSYTIAGDSGGAVGDSGDGGLATSALLENPGAITLDPAGDVIIADSFNNQVREVPVATGLHLGQQMSADHIYTIAGSTAGTPGTGGDGGPAVAAKISNPAGVDADSDGDIFIADSDNNRIQEIAAADGVQRGKAMTADDIYTVAGHANGTQGPASGDGGPAQPATVPTPFGAAVDPAGDLFITDENGNLVREVTSTTATTIEPAPGQVSWLSPAPGGITVAQDDGSQVSFFAKSGGSCAAPYVGAGGFCTLPQDVGAALTFDGGSGTYTYTQTPGTTFTYTSNGVLTGESDAAGETLSVTYGSPSPGAGHCPASASSCTTVTSASGRALVLGTNEAGLVTSVTDPMGRTYLYGYSGSDLTSVTDPLGNTTTYTYGAGSTGNPLNASNLLTITEPNAQPGGPDAGDSTVNVYNAAGQVTSQADPSGFTTRFDYCVNAAAGDA